MTFTLILLSIFLAGAVICHIMTKRSERPGRVLGNYGFVVWPIGIMLLAYLSKKLRNNYKI